LSPFLKIGVMVASLRASGNFALVMQAFIQDSGVGLQTVDETLSNFVLILPEIDLLLFRDITIF